MLDERMILVTGRLRIIFIMLWSGEHSVRSLLQPNLSNLSELSIVVMAVINSFQSCEKVLAPA